MPNFFLDQHYSQLDAFTCYQIYASRVILERRLNTKFCVFVIKSNLSKVFHLPIFSFNSFRKIRLMHFYGNWALIEDEITVCSKYANYSIRETKIFSNNSISFLPLVYNLIFLLVRKKYIILEIFIICFKRNKKIAVLPVDRSCRTLVQNCGLLRLLISMSKYRLLC